MPDNRIACKKTPSLLYKLSTNFDDRLAQKKSTSESNLGQLHIATAWEVLLG